MVEVSLTLQSIIPATVLPMTPDYRIDEEALRSYVRWLIRFEGLGGLAVNVDTGEGPHLYREEKREVLRIYSEEVKGRMPIIAGVSASFTAHAIELARDAKEGGSDAILLFPSPAFGGEPLDPRLPYEYFRAISEAVDIPIVAFQLQRALGGIEYSPEVLSKLFTLRGVIALKEASCDAKRFVETLSLMRSLPRKIFMLTGNDTFILESLILGADGALIGFGTVATDLQVEMFEAVKRRDYEEAATISRRLEPLIDAVFANPVRNYRVRLKEALVMLGVIERATVRPPLLPISEEERKTIRGALKEAGLLP
ncbi:MAG: dihydrodipicolinate synthase family protein [Candidatus Geothermarchaeales archaeon]